MSAVTASAAEFYAIVDNFANKPRTAFMDVSVDTTIGAGIDVLFNVYDARGVPLAELTVAANSYGLASSSSWGNLFNLAAGQPILVRAQTPYAPTDAATLHIDSLGASTIVSILRYGRGTVFRSVWEQTSPWLLAPFLRRGS